MSNAACSAASTSSSIHRKQRFGPVAFPSKKLKPSRHPWISKKLKHSRRLRAAKKLKHSLHPPVGCGPDIGCVVECKVDSGYIELSSDEVARPSDTQPLAFHTHELDGVLICDHFLLGECYKGLACPRHHTPLPYHWQLRLKTSKEWVRLGPTAQEHLERNYCNMCTSLVILEDSDGVKSDMDLKTFTLSLGKYDRARRLCTSSDPSVSPYFPAEWRICWHELGQWIDYDEPFNEQLKAAFERGAWNHAFQIDGQIYNVDLKDFTQCNIKTLYCREVRRRPIYRSYRSMAPYLKTATDFYQDTVPAPLVDDGPYPSTWVKQSWDPSDVFLKVPVPRTELAFTKIETHFHKTLSEDLAMVFHIYRIQNKFLWKKYACQKEFMSQGLNDADKLSLEKYLYHGTTQESVDQICHQNFDPRIAGLNGTAYGKGSYFALEANYSHTYSQRSANGYRYMFLAKVLIGKMALGKASYCRPPMLEDSCTLYDTCVDNLSNPKIFVLFDSCQCYPFFLIQYKLLSEPVIVIA